MSKAKHYEIHLTKKQALFTVVALTVCFLLSFSLGAIIGMKYFRDTNTPLLTTSLHDETITSSASNFGTLESRTVSNPDGDKIIHEFTFYNTLPEKADAPAPKAPAQITESGHNKEATTGKVIPSHKVGPLEKYTVQFGSFQQKEKAYALSNKLKKQGYLTHVTTTKIESKGTFYRVRMGSFSTQEEAQSWIFKLGSLSPPPFITSDTD